MQPIKNKAGFTLIELLVVVAIIGILAAVGTPIFQGFIQDAKIAAVQRNHSTFISFMQASMLKCDMSTTIRLNTSDGYKNIPCPNNAWEIAWALKSHFQYENWLMLYPGEWYSSPNKGADFKYAVHTRNGGAGRKICDQNNYAGYICMDTVSRSEAIVVYSITTNDHSIPNRVLKKYITWSR